MGAEDGEWVGRPAHALQPGKQQRQQGEVVVNRERERGSDNTSKGIEHEKSQLEAARCNTRLPRFPVFERLAWEWHGPSRTVIETKCSLRQDVL